MNLVYLILMNGLLKKYTEDMCYLTHFYKTGEKLKESNRDKQGL